MHATSQWLDTNYYEVLGVPADATEKQIRKAYRRLARTAHPDANPDDPTAEQRFGDIAKAYEVLSEESARAEYDAIRMRSSGGAAGFRYPHGRGGDFVDVSDLFADLFEHRTPNEYAAMADWPRRGADLQTRLQLDFVDAINGTDTTLNLGGSPITVRIPAGVDDGQTIRLTGRGQPGSNGGRNGDLLIELTVGSHPEFGRTGRHLTTTVAISYVDAVLGGTAQVQTLDGDIVTLRIPAGTPVGKTFRIRGRGVPETTPSGDLLVSVTIDVPTQVSDDTASLLTQLRDVH